MSLSAVTAGFVAVAVSYAGPMLVVLQAAHSAGLSTAHTTSWIWAVAVASGVTCIVLSLFTRQPVVVAVLAGVLLPFVLNVASAVVSSPLIAGALVAAFLIGRRITPRYGVLLAVVVGAALSAVTGQATAPALEWDLSGPIWTTPTFGFQAIMSISIPLMIVTMAGQNGPGLAVMHTSGYRVNDKLVLSGASLAWLVSAPFGSHGINLAAVTAGICSGREAHEDIRRRYVAGVFCGIFYILFGLFSNAAVALFAAVPQEMMTALAGVALPSALQSSFVDTISDVKEHPIAVKAAIITLVVTASGIAPLGIVSPFWGLLAGSVAYLVLRRYHRPAVASPA